jgi:hypothetical protein
LGFIANSGGQDAIRRKLKEITDGINPSTTSKWAKIIEKTANELCNESILNPNPGIRVTNLSNSFNSTNFNFEIADRGSLECLIIAIERNLNHMPEITRQIFDKLLVEFKAKRGSM